MDLPKGKYDPSKFTLESLRKTMNELLLNRAKAPQRRMKIYTSALGYDYFDAVLTNNIDKKREIEETMRKNKIRRHEETLAAFIRSFGQEEVDFLTTINKLYEPEEEYFLAYGGDTWNIGSREVEEDYYYHYHISFRKNGYWLIRTDDTGYDSDEVPISKERVIEEITAYVKENATKKGEQSAQEEPTKESKQSEAGEE